MTKEKPEGIDAGPATLDLAPVEMWEEPAWETTDSPLRIVGGTDDRRRLMTALAHAQGEIKNARKSSENPHFHSTYADLAEVADACRIPLSRHQIAWTQDPVIIDTDMYVETTLFHGPSGQYFTGQWPIDIKLRTDQQKLGAAVTYAKRFSLGAMVGIVSEDDDDDGNSIRPKRIEDDLTEGDPAPNALTKNQREGVQWTGWALRKVPQLATLAAVSEWEEKYRESLIGLLRILPDKHKEVMDAIAKRNSDLSQPDPRQDGG